MAAIARIDPGPRMSKAVIHGDTVYLMGCVASDRNADIATQTRQVLERIERLLAEAGSAPGKLLSVTIYIADIADFAAMNAVWDNWVEGPNAPARTTVEASLAAPEIKVEMTAVAAL